LPKKKEKVITLRMDHESLQTVEDYAKGKGISVGAYINSYHDNERIERNYLRIFCEAINLVYLLITWSSYLVLLYLIRKPIILITNEGRRLA
jgi:hypothetical protein